MRALSLPLLRVVPFTFSAFKATLYATLYAALEDYSTAGQSNLIVPVSPILDTLANGPRVPHAFLSWFMFLMGQMITCNAQPYTTMRTYRRKRRQCYRGCSAPDLHRISRGQRVSDIGIFLLKNDVIQLSSLLKGTYIRASVS